MGSKRIGLSICDENQKIATPFKTINKNKLKDVIVELKQIIEENNIKGIIVGNPINMDGSYGKSSQAAKDTANDLANKIKIFGKEGVPTGPRKTTTNYKNYELDEDLTTGEMRITKTNEGGISTDDGMIDGISSQEVMEYIPGERILTKEGKSIKTPDMYEEATIRPDMDGKMKDIDDGLDNVQSIIEDAKGEAPSIKKAGGGIARMLGE